MVEPGLIKRAIQAYYDDMGEAARKEIAGYQEAGRLWSRVEGDRPALAYFRGRKIRTALALGKFCGGSAMLEVGCGTGDYSLLFARSGYLMTGVDLSSKSIEAAQAKAAILGVSDASFVVSDAEVLNERQNSGRSHCPASCCLT